MSMSEDNNILKITRMVNINLYVKKGCFFKLTNDLKDYRDISSYDIHNRFLFNFISRPRFETTIMK